MKSLKPKILLIDDDSDFIEIMTSLFEDEEYKISHAADGVEGLALLLASNFDLVVCDYLMPKMDGITLLKKLRDKRMYTPFIFFSGNASENNEHNMANLGAYKVIHKTEIRNLKGIVKKTLAFSEKFKESPEDVNEETEEFMKILHSSK